MIPLGFWIVLGKGPCGGQIGWPAEAKAPPHCVAHSQQSPLPIPSYVW